MGCGTHPTAFQRYMNTVLGDIKMVICDLHLDNMLCYGETFDEGVEGLDRVLRRLRAKGIKLRVEKMSFYEKGSQIFRSVGLSRGL